MSGEFSCYIIERAGKGRLILLLTPTMNRLKRFVRKLLHPIVIITAVIILAPIAYYLNGPGFRFLAPKIFETGLVSPSADFTVDGSILGGFTIENLDADLYGLYGIREFEADELTPKINYLQFPRVSIRKRPRISQPRLILVFRAG